MSVSYVSCYCLMSSLLCYVSVSCQCPMSASYVGVIHMTILSWSCILCRLMSSSVESESSCLCLMSYVSSRVFVRHKPRHKTLTLKDEICSYNNQESQHREKVRKRREKVRKRREQPHSGLFMDVYCNHTGPYLVSRCIMCCSVLLCVAVCCSVLLCCSVAVCCSVCPYLVSRYITTWTLIVACCVTCVAWCRLCVACCSQQRIHVACLFLSREHG